MINRIPSQYRNQKTLIVGMAIILCLVTGTYALLSTYDSMQVKLEDHEQQLFIDQKNIRKLNGLRKQIKHQTQQLARLDRSLLKGKAQDTIVSTMQIQVQSMLTSAGLEPESLRPVTSRVMGGETIQSVVLKLRLSGTIEQFKTFLTLIYKADAFFHIEGLTIKPFKQDQLKIYMDLRGYYQISTPPQVKKRGRNA